MWVRTFSIAGSSAQRWSTKTCKKGTVLGQRIAERSSMFVVGMAAYRLFGKKYMEVKYSYGSGIFAVWMSP